MNKITSYERSILFHIFPSLLRLLFSHMHCHTNITIRQERRAQELDREKSFRNRSENQLGFVLPF